MPDAGSGETFREERQSGDLKKIRRLAWLLDAAVPLPGGFRVGIDGLIGLVPGAGDVAGAMAASYILFQARKFGTPPVVMVRMVGNVLLEMILGAIPLFGDLFDIAFRANLRNVELMQRAITDGKTTYRSSWLVVTLGLFTIMAGFAVSLVLVVKLLSWVWQFLSGAIAA